MRKILLFLLLIFNVWGFSQNRIFSATENAIIHQAKTLDSLMQNNDPHILDLFSKDISFGHSNGWIQNFEDFKTDFESGKVKYISVKQTELKNLNIKNKVANLRRIIAVEGLYKGESFEMKLSVLENWIKEKGIWKLWSRQSVTQKN